MLVPGLKPLTPDLVKEKKKRRLLLASAGSEVSPKYSSFLKAYLQQARDFPS